jgi:O-antigen ligase
MSATNPAATLPKTGNTSSKLSAAANLLEFRLFVILAFVVPVVEMPKNLFSVLVMVVWLFNRVKVRDFGGPWRIWDSIFLGLVVAPVLVAIMAPIHYHEWRGIRDVLRFVGVGWVLSRSDFSLTQLKIILLSTMVGALFALGLGGMELALGASKQLELHSVGHVNHSAVYLVMAFGVAIAFTLVGFLSPTEASGKAIKLRAWRWFFLFCAAAFAVGLLIGASRIAVLAALVLGVLICVSAAWRSKLPIGLLALATVIAAGAMWVAPPWLLQKHNRNVEHNNMLANRDFLWSRAMTAFREYPLFGIGTGNFSQIHTPILKQWRANQGRKYEPSADFGSDHAHSVYFNTLAERGAVGLSVVLALFLAWFISVARYMPRWQVEAKAGESEPAALVWIIWVGALSGLTATAFVGLFNTTLQTENGVFCMILLGCWLSARRLQLEPTIPRWRIVWK